MLCSPAGVPAGTWWWPVPACCARTVTVPALFSCRGAGGDLVVACTHLLCPYCHCTSSVLLQGCRRGPGGGLYSPAVPVLSLYQLCSPAGVPAGTWWWPVPTCCARTVTVPALFSCRGAGGDLVVACTHLLYNPKRHDVKLAQAALLLAEVDRLAWCGQQRGYVPMLIAGDFNLKPNSPVCDAGWARGGGERERWGVEIMGCLCRVDKYLPNDIYWME